MKHAVQLRLNYIKTKCALEHNLHSQICFHHYRGGIETVITFSFFTQTDRMKENANRYWPLRI